MTLKAFPYLSIKIDGNRKLQMIVLTFNLSMYYYYFFVMVRGVPLLVPLSYNLE